MAKITASVRRCSAWMVFLSQCTMTCAETYYVDVNSLNPTAPYTNWATAATTIQDAVDLTSTGDVVLGTNGVYNTGTRIVPGQSLPNRLVVETWIFIRSVNGPEVTIIEGDGPDASNAVRCINFRTSAASIEGVHHNKRSYLG